MRVCVIGTGYVGLVTASCFADVGNSVIGVDANAGKIDALRSGKLSIYEPNLAPLVTKNIKEGRLIFTTDLMDGISEAKICFICVDTPLNGDEGADLTNIFNVAEEIGRCMNRPLMVVTKSTVPVGTTIKIKNIITNGLLLRERPKNWIKVASNPEFLKEGDAVNDFLRPMRVVVGADLEDVFDLLHKLYVPFMLKKDRFIRMDIHSSELTKYACNGMLATRISFMNELAQLAEMVGADIVRIREAMGADSRIGQDFLYAGLGYGGSCFPKDTKALIQAGRECGVELRIVESTDKANEAQKKWFWKKIEDCFEEGLHGKKVAIWGGAFKSNTDDIRYSPALYFIDKLLLEEAKVSLYDPAAVENLRSIYGDKVQFFKDIYECLRDANMLIVMTDWNEFRSPDFSKMSLLMKDKIVLDGRNLYDLEEMRSAGFRHISVGRKDGLERSFMTRNLGVER